MQEDKKSIFQSRIFIFTLLLIFACFWMFWSPGVKVATDYHLSSVTGLAGILPWSSRQFDVADGLGEYTVFTLWSQPLLSLSALMNFLSIPNEIQTKLMGAVILIIGILGIWKLLNKFGINDWGKSTAAVFFILNSFFVLMFDGGQFSLNLAYVAIPFALIAFMNLLQHGRWRDRTVFSLTVLLVSIFDIRIIFLLSIILGIYFVFKISFQFNLSKMIKLLTNLLISFLFTLLILIGFHSYWLLPSLFSRAPSLPLTYERLDQVSFLSFSSIGHSLLLQQPHWYKNVFGQLGQLKFEFIFIPFLVFLSPILIKKDRIIGFWLTVALIGIFLSKGSQDPFPGVYLWLFGHFPLFSLFRDPVKFYFLTALSYSVLIGFTISAFCKLNFSKNMANFGIKFIPALIFVYFIFLARPIFLGWMNGMISRPIYLSDYRQLATILESDSTLSRVLWLPFQPPLSYTNSNHPPLEASRLLSRRPFAIGAVGTYETLNFLRESPVMDQLLGVSGVGYLAYPYLDPRKDDMSLDHISYYYTFFNQLQKKPWLSDLTYVSKIPLLKVNEVNPLFFITPNVWWVIGSDSIYNEASKGEKLKLSKNALIFAEEHSGFGRKINELPEAKIVLNNKTILDLAASFIDTSDLIFPAKNLNFDPDKSGWWKRETSDLIRWRAFLQSKYAIDNQDFDLGGGWAVGENSLKLKIQNSKFKDGDYLLARVMESSRSGELVFHQEGNVIGRIYTKASDTNVRWFEVGKLNSEKELTITSDGKINVINTLAVLSKDIWKEYLRKSVIFQDQGRILDFKESNIKSFNASVTYRQINPTKYKVTVRGLKEPAVLVFAQNYDQLWKLGNQPALPIYSLLDGFRVENNGDYIIDFEAQKYVYFGLIVSGLTVLTLLIFLVKFR